jgi:hypothetical protein
MAEGASSLRELIASFFVDVDDKKLKEGHKHVEDFKKELIEVGKLALEAFAFHELHEFIEDQIKAGVELKTMATRLGTSTDELQAMQLAAQEAGVNVDAMSNGLRFLNRNIDEARRGGGETGAVFSRLGIQLKDAEGKSRPASEVMADLADKMATIPDAAERTNVAMKLLGRGGAELVPVLAKGGQAFRDAAKDVDELGGGLTEDFVEAAHEAEVANVKMEFSFKSLKALIARELFPGFAEVVHLFTSMTKSVISFAKQTNLLQTAIPFAALVIGFKLLGSEMVASGIKAAIAWAPELLVLAALYLAFSDLYALMTGGESVIGDTIDELFGIGEAAQFAKDLNIALDDMLNILSLVGVAVGGAIVTPIQAAYHLLNGLANAFVNLANGDYSKIGDSLSAGLTQATADFDAYAAKVKDAGNDVGGNFGLSSEARAKRKQDERLASEAQAFDIANGGAFGPPPPPGVAGSRGKTNIFGKPLGPLYRPNGGAAQGGGQGAEGGVVIHQHNETNVEVHAPSAEPGAVGKAVGQGVATQQQRANQRAHAALKKP